MGTKGTMSWSFLASLLIVLVYLETATAKRCPEPYTHSYCKNNHKFAITTRYVRSEHGGCRKVKHKNRKSIRCSSPHSRKTSCKNGVAYKINILYRIKNCRCKRVIARKTIYCPCKKSQTYRKKCHNGRRRVITIFEKRIGKHCRRQNRSHTEQCGKSYRRGHGRVQRKGCKCWGYGNGELITYDRKTLHKSTRGPCSILFSKTKQAGKCSFAFFASMKNHKYQYVVVAFNGKKYKITQRKRLFVNGNIVKVPYESKGVRVFYSGEFLQFVAVKCKISFGYDGKSNLYSYISKAYSKKVKGACGDCDGNKSNDKLNHSFLRGRCLRVRVVTTKHMRKVKVIRRRRCSRRAVKLAYRMCARLLVAKTRGPFSKCSSTASRFTKGCLRSVCKIYPNRKFMYRQACRVHSLAAEACSAKGYLPRWRRARFCPLKCGKNKNYVAVMKPCPKTCENHFFGTSARCFKLPKRDGCQCRPGFVLDGNQCVQPENCRCLEKVCVDRYSRSRCQLWKSRGHCKKNPRLMNEFCRLTCSICKPKCEDQMSSRRCQIIKKKGYCRKEFYKQMCRLTCFRRSCKCPGCKVKHSSCHNVHKIKKSHRICFKLDRWGQCRRYIRSRIRTCGKCPKVSRVKKTKCNYCTKSKNIFTKIQFRQRGGSHKCVRIVKNEKQKCYCSKLQRSKVVCTDNNRLVRKFTGVGPIGCFKCGKKRWSKTIRAIKCIRPYVTKSKCSKTSGFKTISYHKSISQNCKCRKYLKVKRIRCSCPRPVRRGPFCKGTAIIRTLKVFKLLNGRCKAIRKRSVKRIPCNTKPIAVYRCLSNCKKIKITRFKRLSNCRCRSHIRKENVGRCCCPKGKVVKTGCHKYYKKFVRIIYSLVNNKCYKTIKRWRVRCACPRGRVLKYCDKINGHKVTAVTKYMLINGSCKKIISRRKTPVFCRKVALRHVTGCILRRDGGPMRFRRVTLTSLHRVGCGCRKRIRSFTEPCKCEKNKQKKVIPCPARCKNSKTCTDNCFKHVNWYINVFISMGHGKAKCVRQMVGQESYRCCCPLKKRVSRQCKNNKYISTSIRYQVLHKGKCVQRRKRLIVKKNCATGFLRTVNGKRHASGKFLIKSYFGFIRNCKCLVRTKTRRCLWRCPKPKVHRFCDTVSGEKVTVKDLQILRGCKCHPKRLTKRFRIKCPRFVRLIRSKCSKKTRMLTKVFKKSFQAGCKCRTRRFFKRKLCLCPKKRISKPRCNTRRNTFDRKIVTFNLKGNKCYKRARIIRRHLLCKKSVRIIRNCNKKTGVFKKYKRFFVLKNCRCVKRIVLVTVGRCHCKNKKSFKKKYCDEKKHIWITKRVFYVLDDQTKSCKRRVKKYVRQIHCRASSKKISRCNQLKKRRAFVTVVYKKIGCQCRRFVQKRFLFCGCRRGKNTVRHFCDAVRGNFVTIRVLRRWVEEANKCVKTIRTKRNPVHCRRDTRIFKSRCNGKYYIEKLSWHERNPNKCECKLRVKSSRKNCHCPTKIIRRKCPTHGYFKKTLFIYRKWNSEKGQCEVSKRKTFYKRCRCPPPKVKKYCHRGYKIKETTHFRLHRQACVRITRKQRFQVHCDKYARRHKKFDCQHKTCMKKTVTYGLVNLTKKCGCQWKPISVKKCRCCGCPHRTVRSKCAADKFLVTRVVYHTPKRQCSNKCDRHVRRVHRKFRCSNHAIPSKWGRCYRSTCKKQKFMFKRVIKNCKCHIVRIAGPKVTCCCRTPRSKKTFCQGGKVITRMRIVKLKNNRCVKFHKQRVRLIRCNAGDVVLKGKCNKDDCQRKIWSIVTFLNKSKCRCQKKKVFRNLEPCCCLRKPYVKRFCDGECIITKQNKFGFNYHSKSCVKKTATFRRCQQCPRPSRKTGHCQKKTCLRFYFKYRYIVKNCKCHRITTRYAKKCCCPKASPWVKTCDLIKGEYVYRRVFYKLQSGRCVRYVKEKRRKVFCGTGQANRRLLSCNKSSCRQKIVTFYRGKKGCRCIKTRRVTLRTCCCPKPVKQMRCVHHNKVVRFTKYWVLTKGRCRKMRNRRIVRVIGNCTAKRTVSKCNPTTRKRTVKTLYYKHKNCKCVPHQRKIRRFLCACPRPFKKYTKCNRKTCQRKILEYGFIGPNQGKCRKVVEVFKFRCCCPGKKTWLKRRCNSLTGNWETAIFKRYFTRRDKSCRVKRRIIVKKISCGYPAVRIRGVCNKRTGFRINRSESYVKDLHNCKCRKAIRHKKALCSCQHIKCRNLQPRCINGYIVKKRICYKLQHNKCLPVVKITKKKIVCRRGRHVTRKCSHKTCKAQLIITWTKRQGCRCLHKKRVIKKLCCCPRPRFIKKCNDDTWKFARVSFKLNKDNTACKRIVNTKHRYVKCKRTRTVQRLKCNRHSCKLPFLIKIFRVKNCRCMMVKKRSFHKMCCCPKNKKRLRCFKKFGVIQTVHLSYKLVKGQCMAKKSIDQNKIVCPPRHLTRSSCNLKTRKSKLIKVFFVRKGCRCVRQVRHMTRICVCPKSRIVKEKCAGKTKRRVLKIFYRLPNGHKTSKCSRHVKVLYYDYCRCPRPIVQSHCVNQKIETEQTSFVLVKRYGRKVCRRLERIFQKRIKCARPKTIRTKCFNFKRRYITTYFKNIHCQCKQFKKEKSEACNCKKKNNNKKYCRQGALFVEKVRYFSKRKARKCLMHKTFEAHPVVCPEGRTIRPITKHCSIRRNFGIYRKLEISWVVQKGCKCIKKKRYLTKLCHCNRKYSKLLCIADDSMMTFKMSYYRINGRCLPKQEVLTRDISCNTPPRVVKYGKCIRTKSGCVQRIAVREFFLKNCKCLSKVIRLQRVCCKPKNTKRKFCVKENGYWMTVRTLYKLVSSKPLYMNDDYLIWNKKVQRQVKKTRVRVVCPMLKVREQCNKHNGNWARIITRYIRVGCHCVKKIKIVRGKCTCPVPKIFKTKCKENFRRVKKVFYRLINRHCVRFASNRAVRCSCPKPITRVYCDGAGRWVRCKTRFLFINESKSCRLKKRCVRWHHNCMPSRIHKGICNAKTHMRRLTLVRYKIDLNHCKCKKKLRSWSQYCSCKHLNRKQVRCVQGVVVKTFTKHRLRRGQCPFTRYRQKIKVECEPKSNRFFKCNRRPGHPNRGYKIRRVSWYQNVNCKCQQRHKDTRHPCDCKIIHGVQKRKFCKGDSTIITRITYHVLRRGMCVKRSKITKFEIGCPKARKLTKGPCKINQNGVGYRHIEIFSKKPRHCKCILYLAKSKDLLCKCPQPRKYTRCVKHKQFMTKVKSYSMDRYNNKCKTHVKVYLRGVKCKAPWNKRRCDRTSCIASVVRYSQNRRNCKCITRHQIHRFKCCCPKPSKKRAHCDSYKNALVTNWKTFQLRKGRCITRKHRSSLRIRCERKQPLIRVSKCDGKKRVITITSTRSRNCRCVRLTKHKTEKCGCPKKTRQIKGKCNKYWALDKVIALRFVKSTQKCVWFTIKRTKRRCACPPSFRKRFCRNNHIIIDKKIRYILRSATNSCEKKISLSRRRIHCSSRPRIVRTIRGKCDKSTHYRQRDTRVFRVAKKCRCFTFKRTKVWPCACFKIHPAQVRKFCKGNNRIIKLTTIAYNQGHQCRRKIIKRVSRVNCSGTKVKRGKCIFESGKRPIITYTRKALKCKCVWRRSNIRWVVCRCRKPRKDTNCVRNAWQTIRKRYYLRNDRCIQRKSVTRKNIRCNVGTKVKVSTCDYFKGYKVIKTIVSRLNQCKCLRRVAVRKCRCICPRAHQYTLCEPKKGILRHISVRHSLQDCRCIVRRHVTKTPILCKPTERRVTKCQRSSHKDSHKTIIVMKHRRDGCKCQRKLYRRNVLCACAPRIKKNIRCLKHKKREIVITKRVLENKKCVRISISKKLQQIRCPRPSVTRSCNKKTGIEVLIYTRFVTRNCKCHKQARTVNRRCKCDSEKRLIKRIGCNKRCLKTKIFRSYELVNHKCIARYTARRRVCCCPKKRTRNVRCIYSEGVVEKKLSALRLVRGRCRKIVRIQKSPIHCEENYQRNVKKHIDGTLKITVSKTILQGCACKRVHKFFYRKWHCPKSTSFKRCVDAPMSAYQYTTVAFRRTRFGTCKKMVRVKLTPIKCPDNISYWSDCKRGRNSYYKKKTTVRFIAYKCRCKKQVHQFWKLCRCDKPIIKKFCRRETGEWVRLVTKFVSSGGKKHCDKSQRSFVQKVHCNPTPRYSGRTRCLSSGVYYRIFKWTVRMGCRCKTMRKRIPCICKCKKPMKSKICKNHMYILTKRVKHHLKKCACVRRVSITKRKISCGHSTIHRSKCGATVHCRKTITVVKRKASNCRCFKVIRKFTRRCCCPKPTRTKRCHKGAFETVTKFYKLTKGRCVTFKKVHRKPVYCSKKVHVQIAGRCRNEKQKHMLYKSFKVGCGCRRMKKKFFRKCLCPKRAAGEIVFVVDESVHSRVAYYSKRLNGFIKKTTSLFHIGQHHFRFALVKYSLKPSIAFHLNQIQNHQQIFKIIDTLPYRGRKSNLAKALWLTRKQVLQRARKNVPRQIFIITDYIENYSGQAQLEANKLKSNGVIVNIVAVGPKVGNKKALQRLSSGPTHFDYLGKMRYIRRLPKTIITRLCGKSCPGSFVKSKRCSFATGCKRRIYFYNYKFNKFNHKCVRTVKISTRQCCCPLKPMKKKVCYKNRFVLINVSWAFVKRKCQRIVNRYDISANYYSRCKSTRRVRRGSCGRNNRRVNVYTRRRIVNCKCRTFTKKVSKVCRCPQSHKRKFCKSNKAMVTVVTKYKLRKNHCIRKHTVHASPIRCPLPKHFSGSCDRISCQRKISYATYYHNNCRCQKRVKFHNEICCCKRNTVKFKRCANNSKWVYITRWQELNKKRKTCVKKAKRTVRHISCFASRKVRSSGCGIRRGKVLYKSVEMKWPKLVQCKCLVLRRIKQVPCGCVGGSSFRRCVDGYVIRYKIFYVLKHKNCIRSQKVVSKKRTVCNTKKRVTVGACHRDAETGRGYRKQVISWQTREGCRCRRHRSLRKQLCTCPKKRSFKRCEHNKKLVTYVTFYKLANNKSKKCIRFRKRFVRRVVCKKPSVRRYKCKHGVRKMAVTLFHSVNCQCQAKMVYRRVGCKRTKNGRIKVIKGSRKNCINLIPTAKCEKLERHPHNICDRKGRFRDQLCRATCKRCRKCKPNQIGFKIQYRSCIVSDKRYAQRFHVKSFKNKPYIYCQRMCKSLPGCLSFDYYLRKQNMHEGRRLPIIKGRLYGNCVLNTVDPQSLSKRVMSKNFRTGASYKDLKRQRSHRCILSRKVCVKSCPPPVVKTFKKCHCLRTPKKHAKHCFRVTVVDHFILQKNGHCLRRHWRGLSPCKRRYCDNKKSNSYCQALKMSGKCLTREGLTNCKRTCTRCQCNKSYIYRTSCRKNGYRRQVKISYKRHSQHNQCTVIMGNTKLPCAFCSEGQFRVVHKCKNNKRVITTVRSRKRRDGSCGMKTHRRVMSCAKCSTQDLRVVGGCHQGILQVSTHYTVRVKSCCRLFKDVRRFRCDNCPRRHVKRTQCSEGYRLRHVYYYVRYGGRHSKCAKRVYTRKESCRRLKTCFDEMSKEDCHSLKTSGGCRKNIVDAKRLCAATCKLC